MQLIDTDGAPPAGALVPDQGPSVLTGSRRVGRLPLRRKAGYAAGQLVDLVVSSMLNIFVLFYVTAVCGLPGGLAGLALGGGIVVDAVMDPLIGSLSDGWRSRFGRRVPFMVGALVPLVLTFNLMFALPSGLGQAALFLWLMLLSVCLRISLSMFHLPYQALGAELSDDYDERSSIAVWRWGIGITGTLAVVGLGYGVFLAGPAGVSNRAAYLSLTLTLSVLLLAGALVAIRQGLATRYMQHQTTAPTEAIHLRLYGEMREMFRNRTFRILFAASLFFNIELGVNQALGLHVATFFWGLSSKQMQIVFVPAVLGLAVGAPLAVPLWKRFEKRTVLLIGMIGMVTCHALPVSLQLLGLLHLSKEGLIAVLSPLVFLGSLTMALSLIAFLSIIPDAADEHEHLFGTRREGLYFAGWAFATKAATGGGVLIAGVVLQILNFPAQMTEQAHAVVLPARTISWLAFAQGPGAALLSIAGIALALRYPINKQSHARIISDLTARKRAAP
ncbi:MFS transporter [Paraburkholderia saeva]|uniref:Inner membrane symporter YicJ n=1 Tax=Paraburkholderia saeva TaxID=2777537 RepID=A0A9N8RWT5_9BURK|nr:MFS transporter [Paraburkholderia saeva]CAG4896640.1 Inner membrane symporter YicJ [Paraburkholderia saeva]